MKIDDTYNSTLDIAAANSIKTIKGISSFMFNQRLRFKQDVDPETFILKSESEIAELGALYEDNAEDGIGNSTNRDYVTINDNNGLSLIPPEHMRNDGAFSHRTNVTITNTDEATGAVSTNIEAQDLSKNIGGLAAQNEEGVAGNGEVELTNSIDILDGAGDPYTSAGLSVTEGIKAVQSVGQKQVLKGNTMEEFLEGQGSIEFLGQDLTLANSGLGGMMGQALNTWNQGASLVNMIPGVDIPTANKQDNDPLYADNNALEQKKSEYEKVINPAYANSQIYNRLANLSNNAAGLSNLLAPQNFNLNLNQVDGLFDGIGQATTNWWNNTLGRDSWMNPTTSELLMLNTANFNSMSLMNGRPEISIKHDHNQRTPTHSEDWYSSDGISGTNQTKEFQWGDRQNRAESPDSYDSSGLLIDMDTRNSKYPPRIDTYPDGAEPSNYVKINSPLKTFLYPSAETSVEVDKYNSFIDNSRAIVRKNLNINSIRPDDTAQEIKHLIKNTLSHAITSESYPNMPGYYSAQKSSEEMAQINALVLKNNFIKDLGYLYIRPYPGTYEWVDEVGNASKEGGERFDAFTIPFEFSPKISEASTTVQYSTEQMLNHIGQLRTYTGTEPGIVTLEAEYLALSDGDEYKNQSYDISKNWGTDAWQYLWDINRIENLEYAYRSLAFPVNSQKSVKPGIIKPPMIKILMQTDPSKEMTVGNLYRYPYTQYENSGFNLLGTIKTNAYYLQNMQIDGQDPFRTYKTYICTDVNISHDEEKFAVSGPSYFTIKNQSGEQQFGPMSYAGQGDNVYDNVSLNPVYKITNEKPSLLSTTEGDLTISTSISYYRWRGFKVTLTLVEITENYLDAIPDFAAYYFKFMHKYTDGSSPMSTGVPYGSNMTTNFNNFRDMELSALLDMVTENANLKETRDKYEKNKLQVDANYDNISTKLNEFQRANEEALIKLNELEDESRNLYNLEADAEKQGNLLLEIHEESNRAPGTEDKINTAVTKIASKKYPNGSVPPDEKFSVSERELESLMNPANEDWFNQFKSIDSRGKTVYNLSFNDFLTDELAGNKGYTGYIKDREQQQVETAENAQNRLDASSDRIEQLSQDPTVQQMQQTSVTEILPNGDQFTGSQREFIYRKEQQLIQEKNKLGNQKDSISATIGGTRTDGTVIEPENSLLGSAQEQINNYIQNTATTTITDTTEGRKRIDEIVRETTTAVNNLPG